MNWFRSIALPLALAGILATPAAAIELPDLGDASRSALSENQEERIGREIMRQIRESSDYLDDAVVADYLANLGDRLVAASTAPGRHFEFFPVRDATINAFALPGGYIGVHTGLISAARNESELAGVLSHEIAHVTQQHIARMVDNQRNASVISLAALAVAILAARSNSQMAEAALAGSAALSLQNQLDFTRENEREADRVGLRILDQAGFALEGMASFFERLQAQGRLYENNAPAYMRTHPLTFERIADMQNRVGEQPYRQHTDSVDFKLVRARVQAAQGEARDAVTLFEARVREQEDAAAWYGLLQASLRAGDLQRARRALGKLGKDAVSSPLPAMATVEVALAEGRADEAIRQARVGLAKYPGYRPLAYLYARALLRAKRVVEALDFLDERRRDWPSDPQFQLLLAEAYGAAGQNAKAHLAQAEAYALSDRIAAAIEQLRLAQRAGNADFYTLSIIDARLRELREIQSKEAAEMARKGK
jgi:predicted Zn-dependent protease